MSCALCGGDVVEAIFSGSDRLYRTTSREFQVARCAKCGVAQLSPMPRPEELGEFYPKNYWFSPDESAAGGAEEAYRRLVLRDHVQFAAEAIRQGPVLDVGCGGGLFLGMLRERGFSVIGLDNSADAAKVAWRQQAVPAVVADFTKAPLPPRSCGAITMYHVLEHLHHPAAFLRAAYELLRDDGALIAQVPNEASWQARVFGRKWNGYDVPRHLIDFRERDLVDLLETSGFRVVRRKHFSLRDNPAGLASSVAPGLDPMARRVRRIAERPLEKLVKDFVYLGIVVAGLPFAVAEAVARAGATIMVEARKR